MSQLKERFIKAEPPMATVQESRGQEKLSPWDFFYALDMAIACLLSYSIITYVLSSYVARPDAFLGGMWGSVATVFVFRLIRVDSLSAGISRLIATCVSFALCLVYLVICGTGRAARPRHGDHDVPRSP